MERRRHGGLGAAAALALALAAGGLAGCGGGGGGGGTSPSTGTGPSIPPPATGPDPAPERDELFTGAGTNVAYVDTGLDPDHNQRGRNGIQATAPGVTPQGIGINDPASGFGRAPQILREAGENHQVVSMGFGTDRSNRLTRQIYADAMNASPQATYIIAAPPNPTSSSDQTALARAGADIRNGLVAAAVRNDEGLIGDIGFGPKRADGYTCAPVGTSSCISVNMNRGSWQHPEGRITSSWAVAKLGGYAALLREAFETTNGADLVRIILEGRIGNNVFSLARALERGGLLNIGNDQDYASNAIENDEGVAVDNAFAGWTARALAGPGAAVPVARAAEPGGLGLAAFATPDAGAKRIAGIAASWRGLSWGALVERDGFLGRPSTALLGATDGRWTWLGWSGRKRIGRWDLAAGAEVAFGTADASRSHVVEDYGTVVASAWHAEAAYAVGEAVRATLQARQPPRTERARIRLRHNEGVVGVSAGRELRFTASLIGARGWRLSLTSTEHPGHDARAAAERRIQAGWWIGW